MPGQSGCATGDGLFAELQRAKKQWGDLLTPTCPSIASGPHQGSQALWGNHPKHPGRSHPSSKQIGLKGTHRQQGRDATENLGSPCRTMNPETTRWTNTHSPNWQIGGAAGRTWKFLAPTFLLQVSFGMMYFYPWAEFRPWNPPVRQSSDAWVRSGL